MLVELTTVKLTVVPPMVTAVAPAKSVPVMTMLVPPAAGPAEGETLVTVGAVAGLKDVSVTWAEPST